jgi:hypothetical protein
MEEHIRKLRAEQRLLGTSFSWMIRFICYILSQVINKIQSLLGPKCQLSQCVLLGAVGTVEVKQTRWEARTICIHTDSTAVFIMYYGTWRNNHNFVDCMP